MKTRTFEGWGKFEKQWVKDALNAGANISQIAKEFGLKDIDIRKAIKKYKIK